MKISIIGLGAIGSFLLNELVRDGRFEIVGLSEIDSAVAAKILAELSLSNDLLKPIDELPEETDVYVEAASGAVAKKIAKIALERGKIAIIASVGGLEDIEDLVETAKSTGGKLFLPSGAVAGLDALKAIPRESIESIRMKSTKPAGNLIGTDYVKKAGLELEKIEKPVKVFEGSARDAAKAFPKSANVAATVGLGSVGLDEMMVEIWADPFSNRNRHEITVESGHGTVRTEVSNVPFEINPRTSKLAAYSILATIRSLVDPVVIGT